MKSAVILGAMLLAGMLNAADAVQTTDWNDSKIWKSTKVKPGTDGAALEAATPCLIESSVLIPVNANNVYRFSGEVRKVENVPSGPFFAGFILYDKDKKAIQRQHVEVVRGTDTLLAADAKSGDSSIRIRNGARWQAKTNYFAAFHAAGIPNRDLSPSAVSAVKRDGETWVISFAKPLQKSYPAGTKVRIQAAGAYFYIGSLTPDNQWRAFGKDVKGTATDTIKPNLFWPGTAYIAPMMMANWNWGSPEKNQLKTQIRNLKVEISGSEN